MIAIVVLPSKHCLGTCLPFFSMFFWEVSFSVSLQQIRLSLGYFFEFADCGVGFCSLGWFKKTEHSHLSGRVVNMGLCEFSQIISILGTRFFILRTNHSRVVNWNIVERCLRIYYNLNVRKWLLSLLDHQSTNHLLPGWYLEPKWDPCFDWSEDLVFGGGWKPPKK